MARHLMAGAAVLAILACGAARAQTDAPGVETVLAANRAAEGALPAAGTTRADYAVSGQGMTGTASNVSDLATGAFIDSYAVGLTSGASGYDGSTPWMRDLSGANTPQEGGDRIQLAVNAAYRNANLWWRADRGGAEISYAGRDTVGGRPADHLVVTPRHGKRFDAWFDAETHLLSQLAEEQLFFKSKTVFADYRPEAGSMQAHRMTVDDGSGEANAQKLELTRFTVAAAQPAAAYARPTASPTGAEIDGGAASVTVPFRLLNNHVYVQGRVNGKGPYTFIVDTGGHTIMSPRVVAEAGLATEGAASTSGSGDKTKATGFARIGEISIGGVRMRRQIGLAMSVYEPEIEGIPVDGMVGFELFRRFAVRIDYGARTMTITDPARFEATNAGTPIHFKFYDHLPQVAGLVDDLPALFDIDTGSRSEVDLTSPFVERAGLRARYPGGVTTITGVGVGGPSKSYVVRLQSLTLGGVKVQQPVAALSSAKGGSFSDANYQGNIGSAFLKRFVVTFDYAHQMMYLKPITPPPVDAGRFDRSGMWINASAEGFPVAYVAEGGPAAQAGIAVGDVITRIDGEPAISAGLSDARTLLRSRPGGTRLPVEIRRGDTRRTVEIVLRDQI